MLLQWSLNSFWRAFALSSELGPSLAVAMAMQMKKRKVKPKQIE